MAGMLCGSTKAIITKTWHLRNGKAMEERFNAGIMRSAGFVPQKIPSDMADAHMQHCHIRRYRFIFYSLSPPAVPAAAALCFLFLSQGSR
jgi:hypothetical protein